MGAAVDGRGAPPRKARAKGRTMTGLDRSGPKDRTTWLRKLIEESTTSTTKREKARTSAAR